MGLLCFACWAMLRRPSEHSLPSVPGPEYLDDGDTKVTKASDPSFSTVNVKPAGEFLDCLKCLGVPYPSNRRNEGGRKRFGGRIGMGTVQPAKRVLPCFQIWNSCSLTRNTFFPAGVLANSALFVFSIFAAVLSLRPRLTTTTVGTKA